MAGKRPRLFDTDLRLAAAGPRGVPTVNNFRFLMGSAGYVLHRMRPYRGQPVVPVTDGNGSIVVLFGAEPVRAYFTDNETFHRAGEGVFNLPAGRPWSRMFEAVITANGEDHRRRRRLLMPVVQKTALDHYREVFAETYAESRFHSGNGDTGPFDMTAELLRVSKTNMLRCLLGLPATPENMALAGRIVALAQGILRPEVALVQWNRPWTPYGRWVGAVAAAYADLARLIEERRGEPGRPDALSIICNTTDEQGGYLTIEEIAGELHGFFSAGFETTAMTMTWALLTILASGGEYDLADEAVVDACVKESQRLLPTVPMSLPRRTTRPFAIGGAAEVPAGALAFAAAIAEHHDPRTYERPRAYRPERWTSGEANPKPWEFFPFGIGARRCLGAAFADLQARVMLQLMGAEGRVPRLVTTTVDYKLRSGVVAGPAAPVMVAYDDAPTGRQVLRGSVTKLWDQVD